MGALRYKEDKADPTCLQRYLLQLKGEGLIRGHLQSALPLSLPDTPIFPELSQPMALKGENLYFQVETGHAQGGVGEMGSSLFMVVQLFFSQALVTSCLHSPR